MNKKTIIAVTIACALGGAAVHASAPPVASPAFSFTHKDEVNCAFDELVARYPKHANELRGLERAFNDRGKSDTAVKMQMMKAGHKWLVFEPALCEDVKAVFGTKDVGYKHIRALLQS